MASGRDRMEDTFSISKAFSEGFSTYFSKPLSFSGYYLLFTIFMLPLMGVQLFFSRGLPPVSYLASMVNGIFGNIRSATMASIGFNVRAQEQGMEARDTDISTYLLCALSGFLYSILVGIGCVLFIIPGIYWGIKYMFYYFFIVDEDCGPIEALSESGDLTDGYKWKLLLLLILVSIFGISGYLIVGVGVLVTGPISTLVLLSVYKQLKKIQQEEMDRYIPKHSTAPMIATPSEPVVVSVTDVEILEEY